MSDVSRNIAEHISSEVTNYLKESDKIREEWLILKKSARCGNCSIWFYNNVEPYQTIAEYYECEGCSHVFCNNCGYDVKNKKDELTKVCYDCIHSHVIPTKMIN